MQAQEPFSVQPLGCWLYEAAALATESMTDED
jgi:hypothetical protein